MSVGDSAFFLFPQLLHLLSETQVHRGLIYKRLRSSGLGSPTDRPKSMGDFLDLHRTTANRV